MTRPQLTLIAHAALLIGALFLLVPLLTGWDSRAGFLFSLLFQWLAFCLPVIGWHALAGNQGGRLFSEKLAWRHWWAPPLLLLQVLVIALITFVPNVSILTTGGMWLAVLLGLIGGTLDEMAWRGAFLARFWERPHLGFWLCWALSSAAHIPLALSVGIVFEGGAIAYVACALALALFWGWVVWKTGSVFYVAIAHTLTKILMLWVLVNRNDFLG